MNERMNSCRRHGVKGGVKGVEGIVFHGWASSGTVQAELALHIVKHSGYTQRRDVSAIYKTTLHRIRSQSLYQAAETPSDRHLSGKHRIGKATARRSDTALLDFKISFFNFCSPQPTYLTASSGYATQLTQKYSQRLIQFMVIN